MAVVTKPPLEARRNPLLKVVRESDNQKLEALCTHTYPGTLPERLAIQWAIEQELNFKVQKRFFASRTMWRSITVDIVVYMYRASPKPLAIRVQGNYWHRSPGRAYEDDQQAARLTRAGYKVVDCWEVDIREAALHERMNTYMEDRIYDPFSW